MTRLDCGHEESGPDKTKRVCSHLLETQSPDYYQVFTEGGGRTYSLVCPACVSEGRPIREVVWRPVCDTCFILAETEGYWEGICGTPQVREEPSPLAFVHRLIPETGFGPLRRVQPVPDATGGGSRWVAFTAAGTLVEIDSHGSGTFRHITDIAPAELDTTGSVSLACSPNGDFLCLTQTLGDNGVVIEAGSGRRAMRLERDGYHSDVSPFPAVFVVRDGQPLLVHGTAWNRVDISDPATGNCLTKRSPTFHPDEEERPPHYLDYFHGRLAVAPDGDGIADDGWIWHPVGEVRAWSVRRWLDENPWESEDGPTIKIMARRSHLWGGPVCWIDGSTLAVWGYGRHNEWILPAVRLFDAASGKERGWFPGPQVAPLKTKVGFEDLAEAAAKLFFDRYLFAVSEQFGVSVWNIDTGARLHADASFAPAAYHPNAREFLTILADGSLQLSRLVSEE